MLQDQRIKFMNDLLNGIKVIKLYAWEEHFLKLINNQRRKEIEKIKTEAFYYTGVTLMWNLSSNSVKLIEIFIF